MNKVGITNTLIGCGLVVLTGVVCYKIGYEKALNDLVRDMEANNGELIFEVTNELTKKVTGVYAHIEV